MGLGEFAIKKKVITWTLTLVMLFAGIAAFDKLPRLEDPEFTIKQAVVTTMYPGASAAEVEEEVTDVIERAAQELGQLKYVESTSTRGMSSVKVTIKDKFDKDGLPQVWDELRRKVNDYQKQLPPGAGPSIVADDFGDVYGVYAVLTGDGYTMAELKEIAKLVQKELLLAKDVKKIVFWGEFTESIYVEVSREKMAALGITREDIFRALQAKNIPVDAGRLVHPPDYIPINPTGEFTVSQFGDLLVSGGEGRLVRLKDVATIQRGYAEPPNKLMRFNGERGVAIGISTALGGNVVVMGEDIERRMKRLLTQIPAGMDIGIVSLQSKTVIASINGFIVNLVEAVVIVVVVLLIFMGLRPGLIIGFVLFLTIAGTFLVMKITETTLERISLGALIIALGMLVDNAIVVTDGMKVRIEAGMDRLKAASEVVDKNSMPLLGATFVAILAFAGIGVTQDQTGEYCRSLFTVIWISLGLSWVTAVTTTPLLCYVFLSGPKKPKPGEENKGSADPYGGVIFQGYKKLLAASLRARWVTTGIVVAAFVASLWGFGFVKQMFFPDSTRPQFFVDFFFPEGTHIYETEKRLEVAEEYFNRLPGVIDVGTAIGGGDMRFLLTYSPNPPSMGTGIMFVEVDDYKKVPRMLPQAQVDLEGMFPDAIVNTRQFRLGPGEGGRIQVRISGSNRTTLREMASQVEAILKEEGAQGVRNEWRDKIQVVRPALAEQQSSQLGIDRPMVGATIQANFDGTRTGVYREGTELLPIIARAPAEERMDADNLNDLLIYSPIAGQQVPLRQVVTGYPTSFEDPIIYRRDRYTTVKIHADPRGELPSELLARAKPRIERTLNIDLDAYFGKPQKADVWEKHTATRIPILYRDQIPIKDMPGYFMAWGGEDESSAEAQGNLSSIVPICFGLMILTVIFLFNAIRQPLVIFLTVPLAIIGVTVGLLLFKQPFGFMALLGLLSLSGMIIKNSIVLIDEIDGQIASGKETFQAVVDSGVARMMPVSMAAITTILGMIPLLTDAFFVSMAVTIMFGLLFATVLTLVVVPTLYVIFFKIPAAEIS